MYSFLHTLDQFTDFAKQRVAIHSRQVVMQYDKSRPNAREFMERSIPHQRQILEQELAKKVDELSSQNGPLLKRSLGILMDLYLSIFQNRIEVKD